MIDRDIRANGDQRSGKEGSQELGSVAKYSEGWIFLPVGCPLSSLEGSRALGSDT